MSKILLTFLLFSIISTVFGAKTVPTCPEGMVLLIDGTCTIKRQLIDAPVQCGDDELPDSYGRCRMVWRKPGQETTSTTTTTTTTTESSSNSCPPKYKKDKKGKCVKIVLPLLFPSRKS